MQMLFSQQELKEIILAGLRSKGYKVNSSDEIDFKIAQKCIGFGTQESPQYVSDGMTVTVDNPVTDLKTPTKRRKCSAATATINPRCMHFHHEDKTCNIDTCCFK